MVFRIDPKEGLSDTTIRNTESKSQIMQWTRLLPDFQNSRLQVQLPDPTKTNIVATIVIKQQVAFGESLYLRGVGFNVQKNGLTQAANWNQGIQMENAGPDSWRATVEMNPNGLSFKALINDQRWEDGNNHDLKDMFLLAAAADSQFSEKFQVLLY